MKNTEFKITKVKDATVYTLESASAGATGSGSVASVSSPIGGVRKRSDNLINQEAQDKEALKPRNFVAKNAKMGGAGQHKDKKKEMKQGVAKHKKPYMEEIDDLKSQFLSMLKDKGIKHRVQGSPEQEKERTKAHLAQYTQNHTGATASSANPTYNDGFQDGLRGHRNPRASSIYGPMSNAYDKGYFAGTMKREKGMAETAPDSDNRQWSNKDMERLRVATKNFDDIMASDGPEATKQNLIKKRIQTKPIAGPKGVLPEQGVAEAATDDPKFQKMMGNIQKNTPDPVSGYVAVSYASEKPSKKIKGATVNGKPLPATTDDPGQLIKDLKFTPDRIEQQLTAIGQKYGWDLIDPGQGQGYSELYFDTNKEFTTHNQKQLAAMIVKTVAAINKYFSDMNRSLQATGLPGYQANVWQGMGANGNTNQIDDINQIENIARGKAAKADPGPAIGEMILKYIPEYEAENDELEYDPRAFKVAEDIANTYITQGERAGLKAQGSKIAVNLGVSEMIDELLSDHNGSGLRTVWDLDEGYDTAYADQRYKDHEAAMAAKEWEREHNRIKQQHPGGIHGVASGVDAERWLVPYRMLLKNNFKPIETDDRFEYLMQVALKLKGANAGFSTTTGMSNAAKVFGLQPEEQPLVAKLIRSAPHVSEIEKYKKDNSMDEGWGMGGYATAIDSEIQPGKGHEMGENDEYDGEGSMIKNDLHTIVRVSTHLAKELTDDENLPTWVIEKIAQTKGMIVNVMDYMISQHEMGQVYQKENHPDEKEDKALIRKMVKQAALKQETNDPYMMELQARLAEKIPKNAPVKTYIDDFTKAAKTPNAKGHHQFKNKSPEKVRQMAIAASYGAKNPSKKKK